MDRSSISPSIQFRAAGRDAGSRSRARASPQRRVCARTPRAATRRPWPAARDLRIGPALDRRSALVRRGGRRHRHLGAFALGCLPHRKTHEHARRALRKADADPLPSPARKFGGVRSGVRWQRAQGATNGSASAANDCAGSTSSRAGGRRPDAQHETGDLRPSAARSRSRLNGSSDQSARVIAARTGAKSSTTVTVASAPPLKLVSVMRSIESPDAVRARRPALVTLPWFRCSCRSGLPPIVSSSIVDASPRSVTSPAQS